MKKIDSPQQILWVLTFINFFNYFDRQVIFPLFSFLKPEFNLSDFELGLLGTIFMIVHSVASIPLGIAADKWFRSKIITYGVVLWSFATFISGLVQNFYQLLIARSAVGIGEASYAPAATSLLAENFEEAKRAKVNSIFQAGMFAGGTFGMISAGILGTYFGWRSCFFIVAIPGVLLAILSWNIKEKRRTDIGNINSGKKTVYSLFTSPAYISTLIGGVFITFTAGAIISWITVFLVRYHNYSVSEASFTIGLIILVAGMFGIYTGGILADIFYNRMNLPRSFIIAISYLIVTPLLYIIINTESRIILLISLFAGTFLIAWYYGPVIAFIQDIVPDHLRASAYAFYLFSVHLLGDTLSPSIVGKLSDITNLQTALYLPLATNFIGGLFFLLTTKIIYNCKKSF